MSAWDAQRDTIFNILSTGVLAWFANEMRLTRKLVDDLLVQLASVATANQFHKEELEDLDERLKVIERRGK